MIVDATTPPLVGSPGWEYGRFASSGVRGRGTEIWVFCMADVMPRMPTGLENTILLCAYPVCCIHCAAKPQTSRNFSLCTWVGMSPTESCRHGVGGSHMKFDT